MKKLLLCALILGLILNLCGCIAVIDKDNTIPDPPPETTAQPSYHDTLPLETTAPTETTAPQETLPAVQPIPSISIAMPSATEQVFGEDGTLLFSHTYQNPTFYFDDIAVAQTVTVDLLNQIDAASSEASRILKKAKDDHIPTESWNSYFMNVSYSPVRIDQNVLSLMGSLVSYEGGPRSSYIPRSVTYDLITGNRLALQDVLADNYERDTLCTLVLDALSPMADELYWDYTQLVKDQFSDPWLDNDSWYLDETGLCFYFAPYDIAPYATGLVVAQIPYDRLSGILQDAYFPPEHTESSGNISAILFSDADISSYTQFHEVILESEGERILLHTDAAVSNIQIAAGSWTIDADEFIPEVTVFAANTLNSQEVIMLQTYIPDTLPNLQLTYTSGGTQVTVYISQSGKDGSILLLNS